MITIFVYEPCSADGILPVGAFFKGEEIGEERGSDYCEPVADTLRGERRERDERASKPSGGS